MAKDVRIYKYESRKDAEARIRSAKRLVVILIPLLQGEAEILHTHRKSIMSEALWKLTEAETQKYKTRYCSKAVWELPDLDSAGIDLIHEHVFQKAIMAEQLLRDVSMDVKKTLENAFGCVVTKKEHDRLADYGHEDGWKRYRMAGIAVVNAEKSDRTTGKVSFVPQTL